VRARVEYYAPGFWRAWDKAVNAAYAASGGWTVTSWYRDPMRNRGSGGVVYSQHQIGTAFDVQGPDLARIRRALEAAGFTTLTHRGSGRRLHVHAQAWRADLAKKVVQDLWGRALFGLGSAR
jgi:hypothetical protein